MTHVLLIGRGPLPSDEEPYVGFSQLRTQAFYQALREAGHQVRLLLLVRDAPTTTPPKDWAGIIPITEEGAGWMDYAKNLKLGADLIVSAGPYNPGRLATSIADSEPVWVDIPGDPLAELQALALASPTPLAKAQIASAYSGALQVLNRADAISVISGPQRHATWGQLGLIGRLLSEDTTPTTHVLPITHDESLQGARPRAPKSGEDTIIALSGGFNPWFNADGVMAAFDIAFKRRTDLRLICTGGGIPGFFESTYNRFSIWAEQYPNRVHLHGWLPHEEMASILQTAHAGLSLDSPGIEASLGSRTRLLLFAHMGLQCLSSTRCEMAIDWAQQGALLALREDPVQLGDQLANLRIDVNMAQIAQDRSKQMFAASTVMAPLLDWCRAPKRTRSVKAPTAIMAAELDANRDALARVYESPTWRALNRIHALSTALGRNKTRSE